MKVTKRLLVMTMLVVMVLSVFATAFAFTEEELTWLQENITVKEVGGVETIEGSGLIGTYFTTDESEAAEGATPVSVNGGTIYVKSSSSESSVSSKIKNQMTGKSANEEIAKIVDGLLISPNTPAAMEMLSGFVPFVQIIVGIIVTLIMLAMTLYTSFDLCYIAFPLFRNKCEEAKASGSKTMTKPTSNGEAKLRFVTDDAQRAVEASTEDTSKSPWAIYFKRRLLSYVLLAIVMFILLTGNIALITNIALSAVSGVMNVLSSLA